MFDWSNNTDAIDVKMEGSFIEGKSSFKMLGLTISSELDWGSYIISIAKTASKKIGALIHYMKFISPEVVLYLYKSTVWSFMKYCGHVWAGAPSCYLESLDKPQKQICMTIGPHLPSLLNPCLIIGLGLFYRYFLVEVHLNLLKWFHFLILEGGLLVILIDCIVFLPPFLDVKRMSMSTVSFLTQLDSKIIGL